VTHRAGLARDTRHTREYRYGVCAGGRCGHRTHTPDTPGQITTGIPLPMQYLNCGIFHLVPKSTSLRSVGAGTRKLSFMLNSDPFNMKETMSGLKRITLITYLNPLGFLHVLTPLLTQPPK
jgi:hypothetical protein